MALAARSDGDLRSPRDAPSGARRRVLVVSAGMGAGHHAVADELVRRLRRRGHDAERVDVLELGDPGQGERLRRTYAFLLRGLPWVYDLAMRFWARWPGPLERLTAGRSRAFERGLLEQVDRFGADAVVSVYNLSSQALGRLREAGRLRTPVVTYVTDPGAHPYWVHPAVDLHLAVLPATARALEAWGAPRTALVRPLVADRVRQPPPPREETRRRLGLPTDARVALVSAGSWAAGDVERTVELLARSTAAVPVTLCGRDEDLRRRLAARGVGVPLGWTDDVPALMAAADVLVDNAGGLTCWEALARGLPVVVFRPLPGHGRFNARALQATGCAAWARSAGELVALVAQDGGGPACPPALRGGSVEDAVAEVLGAGDPGAVPAGPG
jgi:UDP-N-acetylglucosamine:LPS N-acetylglucosamine transferase